MRRRRNQISGQFSARLIEMLESPAWRALSLSGRRVLDRVEIEHAQHGGTENGNLPVTFDQFVEYGMHRHSVGPGMRETIALGFIQITEKGRAGNAEHRAANKFRLTYRHADGIPGDGSHEWRKIASLDDAEAIADAARKAKAPKKTKNQCRKMPSFSDKNRHRKPQFPVTKNATTAVAKTGTTSISRDIPTEQPAREARPLKGAVASGQADTGARPDLLQARIASRLGADGWEILQGIADAELQRITALEERGELGGAALEDIRLQLRRGAA